MLENIENIGLSPATIDERLGMYFRSQLKVYESAEPAGDMVDEMNRSMAALGRAIVFTIHDNNQQLLADLKEALGGR